MLDLKNISVTLAAIFLLWMLKRNLKEIRVHSEKKLVSIVFVLFFTVYFLILPFMITISALLWIYRNIIGLMLKLKLKNTFYQMVKKMDILHSMDKSEFSFVQILTILECDEDTGYNMYDIIKNILHRYQKQHQQNSQKLYCKLEEWMGYLYYKKIQVSADDYVLKLPVNYATEELNRTELTKLLNELYYKPLPLNNTMLWDIHIGTQPLPCEKPGKKQYPMLLRLHHTIGDGIALVKLVVAIFGEANRQYFQGYSNFAKNLHRKNSCAENITVTLDMLITTPTLLFVSWFLKKQDKNDIHGKCVKKEVLAYGTDSNGKYLKKVKAIKNKCVQTSFSEIIVTVLSASIQDCFIKYKTTTPTHIVSLLPVITDYRQLLDTTEECKDILLRNQFIAFQLKTPIFIENHKDYPLINRLKIVKQMFSSMKTPAESLFKTTIFPNIGEVLPVPILRFVFSYFAVTSAFSIVPGPSELIFKKTNIVASACIFWTPHLMDIGPNFSVYTYNSQLQLGLNCNGSSELDGEAASEIISNIYKNIDLLEKEIDDQSKNCNTY